MTETKDKKRYEGNGLPNFDALNEPGAKKPPIPKKQKQYDGYIVPTLINPWLKATDVFLSALFWISLLGIAGSFFFKNNFHTTHIKNDQVFNEPIQTPALDTKPITFSSKDFQYTATPMFDYEVSGLVLDKARYDTWYSLDRIDKAIPLDFCLAWGDVLKNNTYTHKDINIRQDSRWCWFYYSNPDSAVSPSNVANNHLIFSNDELKHTAESVEAGDLVTITGKLVTVDAQVLGEAGQFEKQHQQWVSSTVRTDQGAGACEVILVTGIEILQRGHLLLFAMYTISLYSFFLALLWQLIRIFITPLHRISL